MTFHTPLAYEYTDEMKARDEALYQFNLVSHLRERPDEIHYFAEHLKAANSAPI